MARKAKTATAPKRAYKKRAKKRSVNGRRKKVAATTETARPLNIVDLDSSIAKTLARSLETQAYASSSLGRWLEKRAGVFDEVAQA